MRTLSIPGLPIDIRQRQKDNLMKAREEYEAAWAVYESLPQTPEEAEAVAAVCARLECLAFGKQQVHGTQQAV